MNTIDIFKLWDWEPSVVAGCTLLLLAYGLYHRDRLTSRSWFFVAGDLILLAALCSPIDTLADGYLFSAHMLQHMLLILAVPPLLLAALPKWPIRVDPLVCWTAGVGMMWIWHWPPLYNLALAHEPLHIFQHLCFLSTAVFFWWPIVARSPVARLSPPWAMVYLFAACVAHTVLAALITFSRVGIYPAYANPNDRLGILMVIRNQWGISAKADQELGGLLMWVPVCLVFLCFVLATMARWYRENEAVSQEIELQG